MPWKIVCYGAILAVEPWGAHTRHTFMHTHKHTLYLSLIHTRTEAQAWRAECDKREASIVWWITLMSGLTCIQPLPFHPNKPLKLYKLNIQQWMTVEAWRRWGRTKWDRENPGDRRTDEILFIIMSLWQMVTVRFLYCCYYTHVWIGLNCTDFKSVSLFYGWGGVAWFVGFILYIINMY